MGAPINEWETPISEWLVLAYGRDQIDGYLIRKSSVTAPAAGRFIKVPFLLGTNFDEAIMFGTKGVNTDSEFLYRCAVCWS
jgi:hypothetical protein